MDVVVIRTDNSSSYFLSPGQEKQDFYLCDLLFWNFHIEQRTQICLRDGDSLKYYRSMKSEYQIEGDIGRTDGMSWFDELPPKEIFVRNRSANLMVVKVGDSGKEERSNRKWTGLIESISPKIFWFGEDKISRFDCDEQTAFSLVDDTRYQIEKVPSSELESIVRQLAHYSKYIAITRNDQAGQ